MKKIKVFIKGIPIIVKLLLGLLFVISIGIIVYLSFFKCEHFYTNEVTKQPTCVENGIRTYTCGQCGKQYEEVIKKSNKLHNYKSKTTKEATCKSDGVVKYTCEYCKNSYTEKVKGEHNWKLATCVSPKTCKICGETKGKKSNTHEYDESEKCVLCAKSKYKTVICEGAVFKIPNGTFEISSKYNTDGTFRFTDLSLEYEKSTSGYMNFVVYYSGEKVSGFRSVAFDYKLFDQDGYVVSTGGSSTGSLESGEKVRNKTFYLSFDHTDNTDLKAGQVYTLEITRDN